MDIEFWRKNGFSLHPELFMLLRGEDGDNFAPYLKAWFEAHPQTISAAMSDESAAALSAKIRQAAEDGTISEGEFLAIDVGIQLYAKGHKDTLKSWSTLITDRDDLEAKASVSLDNMDAVESAITKPRVMPLLLYPILMDPRTVPQEGPISIAEGGKGVTRMGSWS